ncbi:MAG: deoxyribose-phosphate aldolase [Planctomycetia bacterium]|nr:deoxyribose-phosphate aldolase [Planctomycetia bacterium]
MTTRAVPEVAALLDHAVLKPNQTADDLAANAAMCVSRGVGCLCVRPADVAAASRHVAGSSVVIASVVGFPHGSHRVETKALEARLAIRDGARELDMVIDIGGLLSDADSRVRDDIAAVVAEARPHGVLVKVIFETCYLAPTQIVTACRLSEEAGADFVKTSTGFGTAGATPEAVRLMLDTVGGRLGVKASGGIRTWADAVMYLDMGCKRLGVGDAATILDGGTVTGAY